MTMDYDDAPDFDDLMEEAMHIDEEPDGSDYEMMIMMQEEEEQRHGTATKEPPPLVEPSVPNSTTRGNEAGTKTANTCDIDDDVSMVSQSVSSASGSPSRFGSGQSRVREDKKDAFSFERYTSSSVWRSENVDSPERATLRAMEWKKKGGTTDAMEFAPTSNSNSNNMPPDLHLLRHHHRFQDDQVTSKAILNTPKYSVSQQKLWHLPKEGVPARTVTLADGNQRYIAERLTKNTHSKCTKPTATMSSSMTFSHSDDSMQGIFARVKAQRRLREHEKQRRATSTTLDTSAKTQLRGHHGHDQLWVDAHAPQTFSHLLSDDRTNREVIRALRAWDPYVFHTEPPKRPDTTATVSPSPSKTTPKDRRPEENQRVILLSGNPGVGKTTLAHIAARHCGYRPMEVNGSDDRSTSVLTDRVLRAMESTTLHSFTTTGRHQPNCLILDEIDGADANGAIKAIVDIVRAEIPTGNSKKKESYLRRPIIFICNNKYAPALRPLLPFAMHFNVEPPTPARLAARLRSVLKKERLSLIGGSSLLHQLVSVSGGDIRYCLFALQFAASKAKKAYDKDTIVDISAALTQSLNGGGLKDTHSDVLSVISSVFHKNKAAKVGKRGIARDAAEKNTNLDNIQNVVASYGDNSKLLDLLFLNAIHVSFIDPTFDRCSAMYEWMSQADMFRCSTSVSATTNSSMYHAMQAKYIPATAGVVHFLCRVEQRQKLNFSDRELSDNRFQLEANVELAARISEGMSPLCRAARSTSLMGVETASYILWILSAGHGKRALDRAVSSFQLLKEDEKTGFLHHADTLRALGLTYKADPMEFFIKEKLQDLQLRLEPPVQKLTRFTKHRRTGRRPIPDTLKELLAHAAKAPMAETALVKENSQVAKPNHILTKPVRVESVASDSLHGKRKESPKANLSDVPVKKKRAFNFLDMGAKKAKAALTARKMARAGLDRGKTRRRLTHTGSQVPMTQVMRLKYTKGFTQAVRVPCRLEDLA